VNRGATTPGAVGEAGSGPAGPSFLHGVASFDPLDDAVLVWTRVSDHGGTAPEREVEVAWFVAEVQGTATSTVAAQGVTTTGPGDDGCVTVDVGGLRSATTYHYWFESGGAASPIGRTRTLPVGPTSWARLAVTCCADRSQGPLPTYRAIADDEVDVVVHLGDYIYEDPKGPYPVEPDGVVTTLSDYRTRHAHTRLDVDLQALHRRHPVVFVWDDHDVADNAWRHGAKAHDPDVHGPWEERLAAAARARQEWLPARLVDPGDLLSMRRSFAVGDLVELVMLDTRIPGRDRQAGDPGARPLDDPDRHLLDPAQRRWAHERVRDASHRWTVLASAVTVSELVLPVPAGTAIDPTMPSGYQVVDGEALCTDEWDGYPAERAALCDAIEERGSGVVVVSGDVHSNWATYLRARPGAPVVAAEMVCTAVSSTPMGDQLPAGWRKAAERVADGVPLQVWHDLEHHGYLRVDVRPDEVRGDWVAVDDGHGRRNLEVLASWSVDRSWPPRWAPAVPSSPVGSFADVVRPGLRTSWLDGPDLEAAAPPGPRIGMVERAGAALAGVVALAGVLWWLRRRRSGV
jgi:alkaline phosphatase D